MPLEIANATVFVWKLCLKKPGFVVAGKGERVRRRHSLSLLCMRRLLTEGAYQYIAIEGEPGIRSYVRALSGEKGNVGKKNCRDRRNIARELQAPLIHG